MFKEVQFADWSSIIAVVAFVVSVLVFVFFLIGVIRTPKEKIKKEAERPLEKENTL